MYVCLYVLAVRTVLATGFWSIILVSGRQSAADKEWTQREAQA